MNGIVNIARRQASSSGAPSVNNNFIIEVDTTRSGSASDTIILPLQSWGTYIGTIDWGDSSTSVLSYANRQHTYASGGIYTITISGDRLSGWRVANSGDRYKLMDIQNWGIFEFATSRTFQGCLNLFVTAEDNPIIATTNFNSQFESCKIGNPNWSDWDMSSVTDFSAFAKNAYAFNADISGWDTGSVTNASSMFVNAYAFNADISGWNTSSLGNASYMFEDARAFNQNIGLWNTSSIYNMRSMLQQTNSFDQDLSGWDINQVSNLVNFLYLSGLSTANYDALLIAWDAQGAMSFSGTAHFGSSKYTSGGAAEAARTSLISKWGGIIDGGAA